MSAPAVRIDVGGIADLADVMEVMEDSFDPAFGEAWTSAQCASLLPMPGVCLLLAREEGALLGFGLYRVVAGEAELLLLAVRRGARGRGIGALLVDGFAARAANVGTRRLHLEVRDGNPAVNLYFKAGFGEIGRRPGYYQGTGGAQFDALTLSRTIDD